MRTGIHHIILLSPFFLACIITDLYTGGTLIMQALFAVFGIGTLIAAKYLGDKMISRVVIAMLIWIALHGAWYVGWKCWGVLQEFIV